MIIIRIIIVVIIIIFLLNLFLLKSQKLELSNCLKVILHPLASYSCSTVEPLEAFVCMLLVFTNSCWCYSNLVRKLKSKLIYVCSWKMVGNGRSRIRPLVGIR